MALAVLVLPWLGVGRTVERPPARHPSVSVRMETCRKDWLVEFFSRDPRIFDIALMESLRQSAAFFTSASMIAIGGGVAVIGNSARLQGLTMDPTIPQPGELIRRAFASRGRAVLLARTLSDGALR